MDKLKPCPFCGHSKALVLAANDYDKRYRVECIFCGAWGPSAPSLYSDKARALWNQRKEKSGTP